MDSIKRRSSLDDPRLAGSTLRRFAHSPRLSLRRPASTTSSSASSVVSSESHDEQQSCVFIVWAAVKRNTCQKMTPEERRECPLLRCRRRFPDHELLLKHIANCDQLPAAEYWCYDCARVESFATVRSSKKCLGHPPSRRRKIMGMAKNFFSSLGHRTRSEGAALSDYDLDMDEGYPSSHCDEDMFAFMVPPAPRPMQAELQNNEIFEIDSTELPLSTILEDEHETEEVDVPVPMPMPAMTTTTTITQESTIDINTFTLPVTVHPAELESGSLSLAGWQPSSHPATIYPGILTNDEQARSPEKPALQLHTSGLEQYRAKARAEARAAKSRSKYLGPSSSVRSTASTDSTNSTSSTASYNISPISAWSGGWVRAQEFESTLTSPADEFAPDDIFSATHEPFDQFDCQFEGGMDDPLAGQTSFDVPMIDVTASGNYDITPVDGFQVPTFLFGSPGAPGLLTEAGTVEDLQNLQLHQNIPQPAFIAPPPETTTEPINKDPVSRNNPVATPITPFNKDHQVSAVTLIRSALEAFQLHIAVSTDRMKGIRDNPLVDRVCNMPHSTVAVVGLDTLISILEGSVVNSPLDLLCFVHLAYSFSVVVHEHNAPTRETELFSQAVSYASWLTREDRKCYLQIVDLLWKPGSMSEDVALGLMRKASAASRSSRGKGKETVDMSNTASQDSLAGVAQFFLDELECSAILETKRIDIQASDLCAQHLSDSNLPFYEGSFLEFATTLIRNTLFKEHSTVVDFVQGINDLVEQVKSRSGTTPRRFELGLLQIGKMTLPSDTFADSYISYVRRQLSTLYAQTSSHCTPRLVYYRHGVKLIRSTIVEDPGRHRSQDPGQVPMSLETIDDIFNSLAPQMGDFEFSPISGDGSPTSSLVGTSCPTMNESGSSAMVTPGISTTSTNTDPHTAATTPPSPGPVPSSNPGDAAAIGGSKVGSDSCCDICGYRPEGDPRWFPGSMAKHKKLQHATSPPKIYCCPYPGCSSQYRNRPDNLRQHQIKKGHFVESEEGDAGEDVVRRPSKRKKIDS